VIANKVDISFFKMPNGRCCHNISALQGINW
jgi:hypothetical protein